MYRSLSDKLPGVSVRRIFKGTEQRFAGTELAKYMTCYVFTTKVQKGVTATVKEQGELTFFTFHNVNNVPNEVVIPHYCLAEAIECK